MSPRMPKTLNLGAGRDDFIPEQYKRRSKVLSLDIDPGANPHILYDARKLETYEADTFNAIYASHMLEHFHLHEVPLVLKGAFHILRAKGSIEIVVPDIIAAFKICQEKDFDLDTPLGYTARNEICLLDLIYGWQIMVGRSPEMLHKTAFSRGMLIRLLSEAGFERASAWEVNRSLEIYAYGFKAG